MRSRTTIRRLLTIACLGACTLLTAGGFAALLSSAQAYTPDVWAPSPPLPYEPAPEIYEMGCDWECWPYELGAYCQCDPGCQQRQDCCFDAPKWCEATVAGPGESYDSCEDRCGQYDPDRDCQCDAACDLEQYDDCCEDIIEWCE